VADAMVLSGTVYSPALAAPLSDFVDLAGA
jgi:hypothetical protein